MSYSNSLCQKVRTKLFSPSQQKLTLNWHYLLPISRTLFIICTECSFKHSIYCLAKGFFASDSLPFLFLSLGRRRSKSFNLRCFCKKIWQIRPIGLNFPQYADFLFQRIIKGKINLELEINVAQEMYLHQPDIGLTPIIGLINDFTLTQ